MPLFSSSSNPVASFTDSYTLAERHLLPDQAHIKDGYPEPDTRKKVVVTGGSGKLGRWVVKDLSENGWTVINLDRNPPPHPTDPLLQNVQQKFTKVDLNDPGQVLEALIETDDRYRGIDAVVHLAAIPAAGMETNSATFTQNISQIYGVFEACRKLRIRNVVWASSETVLGLPMWPHDPESLPFTEEIERPESSYSLSKLMGEKMADQFARWDPQAKIISLRFSNVMNPEDYLKFGTWQSTPHERSWNGFAYIDARDGAQAVRRSLDSKSTGHQVYNVANADSTFVAPTAELVKKVFPNIPYHPVDKNPRHSLISIEKIRKDLGFEPEYNWQDEAKKQANLA